MESPASVVQHSDLQIVFFTKAGFLALLIYDSLLQINEEYLHVWKSRWTLIKCLYLFTRYGAIVSSMISIVNGQVCNSLTTIATVSGGFIIGVTELILMVRTYTLYERSKKLLVFFFVLWSSTGGVAFYTVTKWTSSSSFTSSASLECFFKDSHGIGIGLVCYVSLLVGETFIVLLTLAKVLRKFHHNKCDLLKSLYCDGVWFYLAILPFTIFTAVMMFAAPTGLNDLPDMPVLVMHAVLACRLITHARQIAAEEDRRTSAVSRGFKERYLISDVVVDISPDNKV